MTLPPPDLHALGWSQHFLSQLDSDDLLGLTPARVTEVRRDRVDALSEDGPLSLLLPPEIGAGKVAAGDWVMADTGQGRVDRLLDRRTELSRRASGHEVRAQLIAANVDTLFVTTSCNDDFSLPRLERALALAFEAGIEPVIVITKTDLSDEAEGYADEARKAARDVEVVALNAKAPDAADRLARWCGPGRTVALIGMSGTGKSTLTNALCGLEKATGAIREDDSRGRHTTTARSLHRTLAGGWLIDTPGMREMGLLDAAEGIDTVFSEILDLAAQCRFRDCAHDREPGCAVQAAIADGSLDPERLARWRKLKAEDRQATETVAEGRARQRRLHKHYRSTLAASRRTKGGD